MSEMNSIFAEFMRKNNGSGNGSNKKKRRDYDSDSDGERENGENWERLKYFLCRLGKDDAPVDCEEIMNTMSIINNLGVSELASIFDDYIKELRKTYKEISSARSMMETFHSLDRESKKAFRIASADAAVLIDRVAIREFVPAIQARQVQAAEEALFASYFTYLKAIGRTLTKPEVLGLLWKMGELFVGRAFPVANVTYSVPPGNAATPMIGDSTK